MGDTNGRLNSPSSTLFTESISPPSLKDGKSERNEIMRCDSPLLDTELLPTDDHANCPYCHRGFRKPRVLDCLHSMCEDCIIAQLDGRREAQKAQELSNRDPNDFELEAPKARERPTPPGVIRCPICSQESHVGNDVRYVHTMLLDYVRYNETHEEPRHLERRCRACKSEQPAVAFCKQCQSDLCSNCLTAHGLMRMFDGHETLTYTEMDLIGDQSIRAVVCPHHHQPYKVLCATCENLACKVCLEIEHIQHKVIEVNERVVKAIEQEVKLLVENVDRQWRNSLAEWSAIPDRNASLHEQYENAKARLELGFEILSHSLEEMKSRKIKELEDARVKQEHAIEDLYHKMNVNEARVHDALNFTRGLLDKANGMELLVSRRKVVQQLNNLCHTMPALGIQVELEYNPVPKKIIDQQMSQIAGTVTARMVSSAKESVSVDQMRSTSEQYPNDYPRLNGNASAPNLPAIGTERNKKIITTRGSTDSFGGWPPSSNPPDLPSVSPPLGQPKDLMLAGAPPPGLGNTTPLPNNPALFGNFGPWSAPSNPPVNPNMFNVAARQQLAMAALMQNNALNNNNSAAAAANALLMQQTARIRAAQALQQQQTDPLLASMSSLTLAGTGLDNRTSPQEVRETRLTELKIHSVFGTSQNGTSIRELHCPSGFCLSETDDILIADTNNHRVVVCGPPAPWKIGKPGTEDGMLCFPRKVVALKGDNVRYVVLDKGADGKTRAQMFDTRGDFIRRINLGAIFLQPGTKQIPAPIVPRGGIEVAAATCTNNGALVLVDSTGTIYCIDVDTPRILYWFDASAQLGEASDIAVYEKFIYITDFKNHCVQVYNTEGQFVRKLGEPSQTPYPIGIDISKNGDILVADTHGNHLHVVVFSNDGQLIQSFTHNEFRLSRCVGLRVAGSGHIVTLCKHNHTLFVFKPLYIKDIGTGFR